MAQVGAAAAALALLAGACSDGSTPGATGGGGEVGSNVSVPNKIMPVEGDPKPGGRLKVAVEAESDGWNPTANRWANSGYEIAMVVFDPLTVIGDDTKAHPYLAESLTPSPDYRSWTVKLRPNVTFHDGDKLNAAAVVKHYAAFRASELTGASMRPVSDVVVVDDLTVRFEMSMPWATFQTILSTQAGVIMSPKSLDDPTAAARQPVGTGPFVFKSWETDRVLSVDKNPNYWRKDAKGVQLPYLDGVDFSPNTDTQSRFSSFSIGEVDVMMTARELTIQDLARGAQEGKFQLVRSKGDNDVNMLLINTQKPPFDDQRVRQAVAHSIDRKALLALNGSSDDLAATNLYVKTSKWFNDIPYPEYNPAKAKELVAQVTAEKGAPVSFKLDSVPDQDVLKSVQIVEQSLKDAGFQVQLSTVEQPTIIANAVTGQYQIQTWRQFGASDPDSNYTWWIGANAGNGPSGGLALNMARNKDPKIDEALALGRSTPDEAVRKGAYKTIQERQAATLPYIWLTHLQWSMGVSNRVRNIEGLTLPDGAKSIGLSQGYMPVTEMWIAG